MDSNKTCSFYVKRKKRYCKMLVRAGQRYCGQHLVEECIDVGTSKYKRIPCPLDPKHSCFEHRLQHHLAICNARQVTGLPYKSHNINLRIGEVEDPPRTLLSSLSDEELLSFIARVEIAHKEHIGNIEESILSHPTLEKEIATPVNGPSVVRHLSQNSSILGHLEWTGLLNTSTTPTCFVEFGAGREEEQGNHQIGGKVRHFVALWCWSTCVDIARASTYQFWATSCQLTNWLTEAVTDISKALFVLVDKGAQRYKFDAKLRYNEELSVHRLRVDIQHLTLEGVLGLNTFSRIVGLGKHLCGSATDLTLHCLSRMSQPVVAGIILALCCHHRCTWGAYSGVSFLQDSGFSSSEFYTLTALTSWATCNSKDIPSREGMGDNESDLRESENGFEKNVAEQATDISALKSEAYESKASQDKQLQENRYTRLSLSAKYREELGRKAKQLLDYGRVKYLQEQGFNCRLIQYVSKETTLENIALLAELKQLV